MAERSRSGGGNDWKTGVGILIVTLGVAGIGAWIGLTTVGTVGAGVGLLVGAVVAFVAVSYLFYA